MSVLVGLTCSHTAASWGDWRDFPVALLPHSYVSAVAAAGGIPMLLPAAAGLPAEAAAARIDALVLTGGADLNPERYGAERDPETAGWSDLRDTWELQLLRAALDRCLPILAVCRGLQLLNVAYGGDLDQHLQAGEAVAAHRDVPGVFGRHAVDVLGGRLAEIVAAPDATVASYHHQGVGRIGEGLSITARSADGVIEGLEDTARPFCVSVLWHPEETPGAAGLPLFEALVAAAAPSTNRPSA